MYSFLDRIARQIYAERRFELEKAAGIKNPGRFLVRARTRDAAGAVFTYRMGAGFPGDVNRTHPVSIEPCLIDASAPPTFYGQPVLVDGTTQGVRPIVTGDSAITDIYGVTVRPFPLQQNSATGTFGSATPPVTGVIDIMRTGYIVTILGNGNLTGALKGQVGTAEAGAVYIWYAASSGNHVEGAFEATNTGGSTLQLVQRWTYNGVQDANGYVELIGR